MKLIQPSWKYIEVPDYEKILKNLEQIGRICYKSEDKITETSAEGFVRGLINKQHLSVLEHDKVSVIITTDRANSHQLVRHRICSFAQESQRFVNYHKDKFGNEVTFIEPIWFDKTPDTEELEILRTKFISSCKFAEQYYFQLIENGLKAEDARGVLPNCTKTEIAISSNLRNWRHFFEMRCDKHAQAPIRQLALSILADMYAKMPVIFEDLYAKFIYMKANGHLVGIPRLLLPEDV